MFLAISVPASAIWSTLWITSSGVDLAYPDFGQAELVWNELVEFNIFGGKVDVSEDPQHRWLALFRSADSRLESNLWEDYKTEASSALTIGPLYLLGLPVLIKQQAQSNPIPHSANGLPH